MNYLYFFTYLIMNINKGVNYMCNNETKTCENCIADILKVILLLQQNVCQNDSCLQTCDRGFLGQNLNTFYNTRPVTLYTCSSGATPLAMPISKSPTETETSTIFRLEKLDDCCATFRVLIPNTDTTSQFPFESTTSFFTINLSCVCILRCLDDTFVESI